MFDKEYVYSILGGEVEKVKIEDILKVNPSPVIVEFFKDEDMYQMTIRYSGIGFASLTYKKIPLAPSFTALFG